jgi:hypothetical protein
LGSGNMTRERVFLIAWCLAWIIFATFVIAAIMGLVKAQAECYVATLTENIIMPSIPGYYQVVPVVVGQAVSCY